MSIQVERIENNKTKRVTICPVGNDIFNTTAACRVGVIQIICPFD